MKKKLLSLLMAGAVVAGSTVPAFAQTYIDDDTQTIEAPVTVSGTVTNQTGGAPAGKIQVEVPTRLTFSVDQKGNFKAGQYSIKNSGAENIQVLVGDFQEKIANGGITVKNHSTNLANENRATVKLALVGNTEHVDLADLASKPDTAISIIPAGGSDNIRLMGAAGEQPDNGVDQNGASEEFNLIFKIKKHS